MSDPAFADEDEVDEDSVRVLWRVDNDARRQRIELASPTCYADFAEFEE
jgi:hypothetical protein